MKTGGEMVYWVGETKERDTLLDIELVLVLVSLE